MTILAAAARQEAIFTYGAPHLKSGPGVSHKIDFDLAQWGPVSPGVIDPGVAATSTPQQMTEQMA